ncbi:maleylpyruvate isomerase family mycothiol-dependent enzyme [Streptomyces sp. NBC_01186]|uniref:maleylpyruvate isomerase family mycothiol-dependent enzyme n=1 Tax=Streptomyces sp. NBC_01186 TaxID=2903765 RepID=UPI002E14C7B7|nr:maleylpyruvate isomerase family mycothiol-dependent enzyme [Streptomyces sp. NBC_01186]
METAEFVEVLREEGRLFADAVEKAAPEAPVTGCPGWSVRDLTTHLGRVHRWARGFVVTGRVTRVQLPDVPELADDALAPWLREGHGALVEALLAAPSDLECLTFLPAPSPLAFWARRQAHETAVHRVDAETSLGVPLTPLGSGFAADGIDELLCGFAPRIKVPEGAARTPRTLAVRATDVDGALWTVRLGEPGERLRAEKVTEPLPEADLVYEGSASDLYLTLWNRLPLTTVTLRGSLETAQQWQSILTP